MDILKDINNENSLGEVALEEPKYIISHLVSANKLTVYLRIELLDKESTVKCEELLKYLDEYNITYGILHDDIKEYCQKREYSKEVVAALGKQPINGKDAEIVYNFDISKERLFEEGSDGTIDFRNLNNIINVTKDTVLAYINPVEDGEDGVDVYGETVRYKEGRNITFNCGSNTYISKDGLQLLSSTDGCIEFKNDKVIVESVYRVNNVDNSTGNIDFIGNVIVNGDVKEGFKIYAKGDIKINGMVEGAYINCDGDVAISKGMNGMGKGSIYAKGNITSKYIENAKIVTDRCVYAEALINSDVQAGHSIILKGSRAAIIGGISKAEKLIYAKNIGSKTNSETNLILDLTSYQKEQKLIEQKRKLNSGLERELSSKKSELRDIEDNINLVSNSAIYEENKNSLNRQLLLKKIKVSSEINDIRDRLQEVVETSKITDYRIIFTGTMFANTRICIGWMKYRVRQDVSYSKAYCGDHNDISIIPLNPGDLEI